MKIPLPAGNFIYIGKGSAQNYATPFITKSADIVRDNMGQVVATTNSYSLESIEKYVDIVFSPNSSLKNFVFLFENIAEIQFPINYITSRIKNGNFVVKRWDDDTVVWSDSATSPKDKIVGEKMKRFLTKPNPNQTFKEFIEQAFTFKYLVGDTFIYTPTLPLSTNLWDICENFWVLPSQLVTIDSGYITQLFTNLRSHNPIKSYNEVSTCGFMQCDPKERGNMQPHSGMGLSWGLHSSVSCASLHTVTHMQPLRGKYLCNKYNAPLERENFSGNSFATNITLR